MGDWKVKSRGKYLKYEQAISICSRNRIQKLHLVAGIFLFIGKLEKLFFTSLGGGKTMK